MSGSSNKAPTSPDLPWKVRLLLALLSFSVTASRRRNYTVNRRLMTFFDLKLPPSSKPKRGVSSSDTTVDSSRNLWLRLFTPAAAAGVSLPVIVYFHGGGFAFMAADSKVYHELCRRLAREISAIVVSVNYRLSPEHRFPCPYEDGFDALKFIDGAKFDALPANADLSRCFLAGDSAGGNLAHHVAVKACEYEFHKLKLAGLICIQPFFGGEDRSDSETRLSGGPVVPLELTDWYWKAFLPEGSDRNHPAANVFGSKSIDVSGLKFPGTVVFVGGFDPIQDWQRKYCEWLKKSGKEAELVEYPNAIHGFYALPELPESSLFIKEVRDFMQKQCALKVG